MLRPRARTWAWAVVVAGVLAVGAGLILLLDGAVLLGIALLLAGGVVFGLGERRLMRVTLAANRDRRRRRQRRRD